MRKMFPTELVFQVFSLLVSFIIVHSVYVAVIRPNAQAFIAQEVARYQIDKNAPPRRSVYVVLKDYEQEACFVLLFWATAILGFKGVDTWRQQRHLNLDLVGLPADAKVTAGTTRQTAELIRRRLPETMHDWLLPRVLLAAIDRFSATGSIQDASDVVGSLCETEADRRKVRALDHPLYRLGDPVDRLHRHGTRHRRRAGPGPSGGRGRHHRGYAEPRHRLQLDLRRADDQHRADVHDPPAPTHGRPAGVGHAALLRRLADPAPQHRCVDERRARGKGGVVRSVRTRLWRASGP